MLLKFPGLCSVVLVGCLFLSPVLSLCTSTGRCKCMMQDGTGEVNLNSLASTDGTPRWTLDGGDGWLYSYNPCVGYNSTQFYDLAVLQESSTTDEEYNLGIQANEYFDHNRLDDSFKVSYYAHDYNRVSNVILICTPGLTEHSLLFVGETITTNYDFILEGPCACPGICDENGIIATTTAVETTTLAPDTTTQSQPTVAPDTTTQSNCDCCNNNNNNNNGPPVFYWEHVGADLVSLIFHDLILVVVIAGVLLVMKFVFGKQLSCFHQDESAIKYKHSEA